MDLNSYSATGRVGQDPEIKFFESGKQLAGFTVAVKKGRDKTLWMSCKAWGKTAEIVADYVRKGSQIAINGEMDCDEWEDRETGKKRTKTFVNVQRLTLLGKKGDETSDYGITEPSPQPAQSVSSGAGSDESVTYDNIPF